MGYRATNKETVLFGVLMSRAGFDFAYGGSRPVHRLGCGRHLGGRFLQARKPCVANSHERIASFRAQASEKGRQHIEARNGSHRAPSVSPIPERPYTPKTHPSPGSALQP